MSPTSNALLRSIVQRDKSLNDAERTFIEELIRGTITPREQTESESNPRWSISRSKVASGLDVSEATIRRLEESGELRPINITGDSPRFLVSEIERFIEKRRLIRDTPAQTAA